MPTRFNDQIDDDFSLDGNDETWELLNTYADGEASPEEAARVEELLRSDATYARQFAFMRTTSAAVQSFTELDPPSSLRDAILASTSHRVTWAARLALVRDAVRHALAPRYATSLTGLAAAGLLAFVIVQHNSNRAIGVRSSGVHGGAQSLVASNPATAAHIGNTENFDEESALPLDVPPVISSISQPQQPHTRLRAAVSLHAADKLSPHLAMANPSISQSRVMSLHQADISGTVVAVAYQPDKDAQFERNPGSVAAPENQPVEIPGDDVHIADADPTPPVSSTHPGGSMVAAAQTGQQGTGPRITVARLTALPPDPNQVLTRADMARNRAVFTSGYDRSTLKSMERKETSISILRGSF